MKEPQHNLLDALPEEGAISTAELGHFLGLNAFGTSSRRVRNLLHDEMIISWRIGRHDYLALTEKGRAARPRGVAGGQAQPSNIAASLGHGADIMRIVAARPGLRAGTMQHELEEAYPGRNDFHLMRHAETLQTRHLMARLGKIPRRSSIWGDEFWLTQKGKTVLTWIEAGREQEDRLDEVLASAA